MSNFTNSPLVVHTNLSPHKNSPRNQPIRKITIHHTAGNILLENLGAWLARPSTRASYNYGISTDGRVGMFVEERNRCWGSSSAANDHQAVVIGVANNTLAPNWSVSETAFNTLIDLCVDICQRNNIPQLVYDGTANGSLTRHNMFSNQVCPGPTLQSRFPEICRLVNARLAPARDEAPPPAQDRTVTLDILGNVREVSGYIENGATFVRLTDFAAALGFSALWDSDRRIPVISDAAAYAPLETVSGPQLVDAHEDVRLLKTITHWEARGEDEKGQILVVNVIKNRLASPRHPNTLREVIFHPGAFTPTQRPDFENAAPNARTIAAVNRALDGEDHSRGATFFHSISGIRQAEREGREVWHERAVREGNLLHLFDHGNHRFYREVR